MKFGGQELLIVLLIVVLIFGARKLPELARSLGASAKEFRKGIDEGTQADAGADTPDAQDQATDTLNQSPDPQSSDS